MAAEPGLEIVSEWDEGRWFEQGLEALGEYLAKRAEFQQRFPEPDPED